MITIVCPGCGSPVSEFDARCAACGADLPSSAALSTVGAAGPPPSATDLPAGTVISHFRITGVLGRGGMGVVYRAVDPELGRHVALKFLAPHAVADEPRLRREAQVAAALDHPNLGTVYEIGEHQGRRFLALALYEGETLAARLQRDGRIPPAEAAGIAGQLAAGLAAAHRAGIVHRDLKPANVFLTREGRVKLLDFGLARLAGGLDLTEVGIAVGTAAYMSPERLCGEESGPAADVWAWGVLLYEMLAGQRPFGGTETGRQGLVQAILAAETPDLARLCPEAPAGLALLAGRCLAKEASRRPTMAEIAAELPVADGSSGITLAVGPTPPRKPRRALLWGGGIAALVLAAAVSWLVWLRPAPPLAVTVAPPQIRGTAEPGPRALVAESVEAALLSTLAALDGVAPFSAPAAADGADGAAGLPGGPQVVRQSMTAEAECTPALCRLTLRRLGADGRVLWTEPLQVSPSSLTLTAAAVSASVRRAFDERRLARPLPALAVSEAGYVRYLELLQALESQSLPPETLAAELAALERREPDFVDARLLDAGLSVHLFERTRNAAHLDRGLAAARRARELAPKDPRTTAALFDLTLAAGQLPEAEELLAALRRVSPSVSEVLLREARLAESRGDTAAAITHLTALAEQHPSWQHLLTLANHESRAGRPADARRHLAELLRRFPGNRQGLLQLAALELMQGDPERGVALFADLARHSSDLESLGNLGAALLLVRRHGEAEEALRRALALAPGDAGVTLNLADALLLSGKDAEAHALYRRLAAPTTGAGGVSPGLRAQALAHLGQPRAAVEAIQEAVEKAPHDPRLAYEAALVYALVGDRASALVYVKKAADGGVEPGWFRFPWFDGLRTDPAFARLAGTPAAHPRPGDPAATHR